MTRVAEMTCRALERGGGRRSVGRGREWVVCRDQGWIACRDRESVVVAIRSVVWTRVVEWVGCSVSATEMHQRCARRPDEVSDEVPSRGGAPC
jgi:hypothetical protein